MSDWTLPPSGDRRGGMYIKTAIGTVVLGCGLGGLVLATILAIAWSGVDRRSRELSHDAAAIVDLRRLDDELAEWATKVDLVLASGQTWFIDDLKRASARMHALLERMEWDALTTIRGEMARYLDREVDRLHDAIVAFGESRDEELQRHLEASDQEFTPLVNRFHQVDAEIQALIEAQRTDLERARATLGTVSWASTGAFLLFIAMLWRWATSRITRPLGELAVATHKALQSGAPLEVNPTGPMEVRMLTASVMSLTGSLEGLVEDRTRAIETMSELRRVIIDTVPLPLVHIGVDGTLLTCNRACEDFFGVTERATVIGRAIDTLPLGPLIRSGAGERTVVDGAGRTRTVIVVMASASRELGRVVCLVDVTDRVEQAAKLKSMLRELDHRVRNSLAAIQTLIDIERGKSAQSDVHLSDLSGRIQSMARAYELLAVSQWSGVNLQEAVYIIMKPWASAHDVQINGVEVRLRPDRAMPVCLLLNELVTNAVKYGSLSTATGSVSIRWRVSGGRVNLTWEERGGPALAGPPPRTGTGLSLVEGFVEHQLGGQATLQWNPEGLQASFQFDV